MKRISHQFGPSAGVVIGRVLLVGLFLLLCRLPARSQDTTTNNADADKAWREVSRATQPPMPPTEWQQKAPTAEEQAKFYVPALEKGAKAAMDFYTKFPNDSRAAQARKIEYQLMNIAAAHYNDTNAAPRLAVLEKERLNDPALGEDERFQLRMGNVQRLMSGLPGTKDELSKGLQDLQKDFPKRPEVYMLMLQVASDGEGSEAQALIKQIIDNPAAPEQVKTMAKGTLARLDAVGKPVPIQYTALDGRKVDLAAMKGKVVLIDFWATWCGPCVGELPHVKAAYDKLHGQGFEIVGISFDKRRDDLEKFVKEKDMAWPQYFDGKGWENQLRPAVRHQQHPRHVAGGQKRQPARHECAGRPRGKGGQTARGIRSPERGSELVCQRSRACGFNPRQ